MSRGIDAYKHLDADTAMTLTLSMTQIAESCVALNYGTHRLLSALVHAIRAREKAYLEQWARDHPGFKGVTPYSSESSELADGIEALLNKGLF